MNTKKSLHTIFIFILAIFAVSGLSYLTTFAAKPSNPPDDNTFFPINESGITQGKCVQSSGNLGKRVDTNNFYTKCNDSSRLTTNGLFVTTDNTQSSIDGKPSTTPNKYSKGSLFVGCTNNPSIVSNSTTRDLCDNTDIRPDATLNGEAFFYKIFNTGTSPSGEKPLCIDDKGKVIVCNS